MADTIITEDNVSKHVLSFTDENFLFTRTVCKSWYKGSKVTTTHVHRAFDSISTVDEACQHHFPADLYNPYICSLENESDISVFEHIADIIDVIDKDMQQAAAHNRIDVLKMFKKRGEVLNEEVLRSAVRFGHLETLKYLMDVGCPVDNNIHTWKYGYYNFPDMEMHSMEIAVQDGRLDIVKQLCTAEYHFLDETFDMAVEGGNIDILKYIKQEESLNPHGEDPYKHLFLRLVREGEYAKVKLLLENYLVDDYKECAQFVARGDHRTMIELLVKHGCYVRPYVVSNSLLDQNMELARYLVREHAVVPTSRAYGCLLSNYAEDETFLEMLNWLHDEAGAKLEADEKLLVEHLPKRSVVIQQWFYDRVPKKKLKLT